MKNIYFFTISGMLLLAIMILLSNCKEEDTTPPTISIYGEFTMNHVLNATFIDPGATAFDDKDGNITLSIVTTNTVNKDLKGTYLITYSVSDKAGNSDSKERTVNVVNSAEALAGKYNVAQTINGGNTTYYQDTITTSASVNNKIGVRLFASHINGLINLDLSGTAVTVSSQTIICGNPSASRTFSGSGTLSGTTITINYTEALMTGSVSGVLVYTKIP